jgi:hypothetical protein
MRYFWANFIYPRKSLLPRTTRKNQQIQIHATIDSFHPMGDALNLFNLLIYFVIFVFFVAEKSSQVYATCLYSLSSPKLCTEKGRISATFFVQRINPHNRVLCRQTSWYGSIKITLC